jgi:hypothetical protein
VAGPSGVLDDVNAWLQLALAIAAALGVVRGLGALFSTTVARPWQLSRKIAGLAPGSRVESIRDLLGPPKFGNDERQTWVFPECFVEVAAQDGQAIALAVTLRRPWFRVAIPMPRSQIFLGRATFSDITATAQDRVGTIGANRWGYSELRPGTSASNFQQVAVGLNDAGILLEEEALSLLRAADQDAQEPLNTLRGQVRFNTYAISAPGASLDCLKNGPSYGVSVYQARLAPTAKPAWMNWLLFRSTPWGRCWSRGK